MFIKIEFGGGLEYLFDGEKKRTLEIPEDVKTMKVLIRWMAIHLVKERPELFISGDSIRPGILVLVNDTDWELLGLGMYELQAGDVCAFISTLHGG